MLGMFGEKKKKGKMIIQISYKICDLLNCAYTGTAVYLLAQV